MIGEFVDLAMIELEGTDELRGCVECATTLAKTAIRNETCMFSEPSRDRRGIDLVPVPGGKPGRRFGETIAAIVDGQCFEDFLERVGFVAQGARAGE